MPNLKIYIDETLLPDRRAALVAALAPLRSLLCEALKVDTVACQFAVLPVLVMADLPRVNVGMQIMPHPDRTRALLTDLARDVQTQIAAATGSHTAVRIATLVPQGYVSLK